MWFAEEQAFDGSWHPVRLYCASQPDEVDRGPEGKKRKRRAIRKIEACYHHLTLGQLAEVYGANGLLQAAART